MGGSTDQSSSPLRLRRADEGDALLLWTWRNEPEVCNASLSPDPIPWAEHIAWLRRVLQDAEHRIWIGETTRQEQIGVVRFSVEKGHAIVSFSVATPFRGFGYALGLLHEGTRMIMENESIDIVHAYVKPGNEKSIRTILKAGYEWDSPPDEGGKIHHLVYRRRASV